MLPIYYIGLVQTIFAALLISKKAQKSKADIVLIVWLLAMGVEMLYSLLNLTVWENLPDLIIIPLSYGPFLFFYTKKLLAKKEVSIVQYGIHSIPFLSMLIVAFLWKGPLDFSAIEWLKQGSETFLSMLNYCLFLGSIFWYWFAVLKLINKHQKTISHQYSFQNTKVRLDWVKSISWWIVGAFIISGFTYLYFIIQNIFPFNPIVIYHLGLLVFVFSISFYGIHQPNLKLLNEKYTQNKRPHSEISKTELDAFGQRINEFVKTNKPYLNGELSLQELAKEMGESIPEISSYLNHYLNKNFFTFINEFRVNEVIERMKNPKNKNLTLLAIAFDSGFNSKSSFNSLFKKYTSYTPSDYQKKLNNQKNTD